MARTDRPDSFFLKDVRLMDPATGVDMNGHLRVEKGLVAEFGAIAVPSSGIPVWEGEGSVVTPGLVDVHAHFREPGFEYKETIASGSTVHNHSRTP